MSSTKEIKFAPDRIAVLRKFGVIMTVAMAVFGSLLLWREKSAFVWFYGAGGIFLLTTVVWPKGLDVFERGWMKFGEKMSVVGTFIFIPIMFYGVVTPIGLIMRLVGKDTLGLTYDPDAETYWVPVEEDGPGTRPFTPY